LELFIIFFNTHSLYLFIQKYATLLLLCIEDVAKLGFIRDDESTTQIQGRLITVVVLVTQNTSTTSLKDKW